MMFSHRILRSTTSMRAPPDRFVVPFLATTATGVIAKTLAGSALLAAMLCAMGPAAAAESYPARPVRMIIPAGAGGVTDILGRVVASKLSDSMGQQVIVGNRHGASGIVRSAIRAKAAPDGYTLLMVFP